MSPASAHTPVRLMVGDQLVASCDGGFADPVPLVLFPEHDRDPEGHLRTPVATAAQQLAHHGIDRALVERVTTALGRLAAASLAAADDDAPLDPPQLAWAGPVPARAFALELRRTALGFEPRFPGLSLAAVLATDRPSASQRSGLYVLALAAHLVEAPSDAHVSYDLGPLLEREDDPAAYLRTLRDAVSAETLAESARSIAHAIDARADALGDPPAFDTVVSALADRDLGPLGQRFAASGRGQLDPAYRAAVLDAAADHHGTEFERDLYCMLVWRAPKRVTGWLDAYASATERRTLDDALVAALEASLPPGRWRSDAVEVGAAFIDAGHTRTGLRVIRLAADVDVTDPTSPPDRALVDALRAHFGRRYGLAFDGVGELVDARFLLDAARHRGGDDLTHLARILCDALVGAAYEPLVDDEEEREAFFDLRIAPGLAYLETNPLPDGGTRRLRAERADESGPGMLVAILFLLGLAAAIGAVGWLIVAFA